MPETRGKKASDQSESSPPDPTPPEPSLHQINATLQAILGNLNDLNNRVAALEGKGKEKETTNQDEEEPSSSLKKEAKEKEKETPVAGPTIQPTTQLTAEFVGFFDPEYVDGTHGPVTMVGKHELYRDVYVFKDRLHDLANTKPYTYTMVKHVIPQCLKNTARMWHTAELTEFDREALRRGPLDQWYARLITRFKMDTQIAIGHLMSPISSYSMQNIRNGQTPRAWIQDMLHCARASEMVPEGHEAGLIKIIYQRLDLSMRREMVPPPTTLGDLLYQVDLRTPLWQESAARSQRFQPNLQQNNARSQPQKQQDHKPSPQQKQQGQQRANQMPWFPKPYAPPMQITTPNGQQAYFIQVVNNQDVYQDDDGQEYWLPQQDDQDQPTDQS